MKGKIVRIGNSQGVRIPKPILEEAGISGPLEMVVVDDGILLSPAPEPESDLALMLMSRDALSDWERPEEDEAWAFLQ
ncbi:AbrB/MazE/SpoVT family DNA-binding domain-containing protein [Humibacter ginsengisoli]